MPEIVKLVNTHSRWDVTRRSGQSPAKGRGCKTRTPPPEHRPKAPTVESQLVGVAERRRLVQHSGTPERVQRFRRIGLIRSFGNRWSRYPGLGIPDRAPTPQSILTTPLANVLVTGVTGISALAVVGPFPRRDATLDWSQGRPKRRVSHLWTPSGVATRRPWPAARRCVG